MRHCGLAALGGVLTAVAGMGGMAAEAMPQDTEERAQIETQEIIDDLVDQEAPQDENQSLRDQYLRYQYGDRTENIAEPDALKNSSEG